MLLSDPAHRDRLRIVHRGVEPAMYDAPAGGPRSRRMMSAGRLAAAKGLRMLLEAFAPLAPKNPQARLVLFGYGEEQWAPEPEIARNVLG